MARAQHGREAATTANGFGSRAALVLMSLALGVSVASAAPSDHPRPVLVWVQEPFEVRVAFDVPVHPQVANSCVGRLIPFDRPLAVKPELPARPSRRSLEPARAHEGTLRIADARLEDQGRTLVLITDPHPRADRYSLHLTGVRGPKQPAPGVSIDLPYTLNGVEAAWDEGNGGEDAAPAWKGVWPELDPDRVRALSRGSVEHEKVLSLLNRPGRLTLETLMVLPGGRFVLHLVADRDFQVQINGEDVPAVEVADAGHKVDVPIESKGEAIDLLVTMNTGGARPLALKAALVTVEGAAKGHESVLGPEHVLLPWSTPAPSLPSEPPTLPDALAGGDPKKGETVFFSEQAKCAACHAVAGKGGKVGPDLGHQFERPKGEVYRDVADPGAWVNPNYVAYTVALKDGRILVGIVRAEGADAIKVTDTDAKETIVSRAEIEEFRPSATSIMPVGLAGTLGDGPLRDLLAYLTQAPVKTAENVPAPPKHK